MSTPVGGPLERQHRHSPVMPEDPEAIPGERVTHPDYRVIRSR